jgi:hypothetical protein
VLQIKPTDLKAIGRVSGSVKDVTSTGGRKNFWNSVHRLILKDRKLKLLTNDGSIWLDWNIPVEGGGEGEFDVLLPAETFNDMAARSSEGGLYDIIRDGGTLLLKQGQRNLRIREESPQEYPLPEEGTNHKTFTVPAAPLAKALTFVAPFLDVANPSPPKTVLTWGTEGVMIGGSPKRIARVMGLPRPQHMMSFKQKNAKAVAIFLKQLEGDVKITIDDRHYTFECVNHGHKLLVLGESVQFPTAMASLEGKQTESYKIDTKTLLSGVTILATLLPAEADRLNLRFKGTTETASLRLSTIGDDTRNSTDEFPIIRKLYETNGGAAVEIQNPAEASVTWIAINARIFQEVLNQMDGTTMEANYYGRHKLLYMQDEKGEDTEITRSLLVTVQPISEEEASREPEPPAPPAAPETPSVTATTPAENPPTPEPVTV